jgi:hypothetical protein
MEERAFGSLLQGGGRGVGGVRMSELREGESVEGPLNTSDAPRYRVHGVLDRYPRKRERERGGSGLWLCLSGGGVCVRQPGHPFAQARGAGVGESGGDATVAVTGWGYRRGRWASSSWPFSSPREGARC